MKALLLAVALLSTSSCQVVEPLIGLLAPAPGNLLTIRGPVYVEPSALQPAIVAGPSVPVGPPVLGPPVVTTPVYDQIDKILTFDVPFETPYSTITNRFGTPVISPNPYNPYVPQVTYFFDEESQADQQAQENFLNDPIQNSNLRAIAQNSHNQRFNNQNNFFNQRRFLDLNERTFDAYNNQNNFNQRFYDNNNQNVRFLNGFQNNQNNLYNQRGEFGLNWFENNQNQRFVNAMNNQNDYNQRVFDANKEHYRLINISPHSNRFLDPQAQNYLNNQRLFENQNYLFNSRLLNNFNLNANQRLFENNLANPDKRYIWYFNQRSFLSDEPGEEEDESQKRSLLYDPYEVDDLNTKRSNNLEQYQEDQMQGFSLQNQNDQYQGLGMQAQRSAQLQGLGIGQNQMNQHQNLGFQSQRMGVMIPKGYQGQKRYFDEDNLLDDENNYNVNSIQRGWKDIKCSGFCAGMP